MEKHNAGTPPEAKILDSKIEGPTRQHDNPAATVDAERMIKFLVYGGAEALAILQPFRKTKSI